MLRTPLLLAAVTASLLLVAPAALGQATYTWNTTTPSNAWLLPGNWTGGPANTWPGVTPNGGTSNGNTGDIAVIGAADAAANLSSGLVIDFNTAGGSLSVGAIHFTSTTTNAAVRPANTTAGVLQLNGATVNAIPKVLLANTSASNDMGVHATPPGSSSEVMGLRLGITDGVLLVNPGRLIQLMAPITEATTGSDLTVRGGGRVESYAANAFTGTTRVFDGTLYLGFGTNGLHPTSKVELGGGGGISNKLAFIGNQTLTGLTRIGAGNSDRVVGGSVFTSTLTLNIADGVTNNYTGFLGGSLTNENNLALVKDGPGTFRILTPNAYAGGTTVRRGTLVMSGWLDGLGTGPITISPLGDAALLVNAQSNTTTVTYPITVNAAPAGAPTVGTDNITTGTASTTLAGAITLNGPVNLQAGNVNGTWLTGLISGTGHVSVTSPSNLPRTMIFLRTGTTANSFGNLTIGQNVTLRLSEGFSNLTNRYVPDASNVSFATGSRLELNPEGTDVETIGALHSLSAGAGIVETVGGNTTTTFTLTVGSGNGSGAFGGVIQQGTNRSRIALIKTGTGTQTLGAANTYVGGTTVNNGTLLVTNPSGSGTGSGPVIVNAGGTLGGTGRSFAFGTAAIPVDLRNGSAVQASGTASAAPTRTDVLTLSSGLGFDGLVTLRTTVGQSGGSPSAGRVDTSGGAFNRDSAGVATDRMTIRLTDDGTLDLSGSTQYTVTVLNYTSLGGNLSPFTDQASPTYFQVESVNFHFADTPLMSLNGGVLTVRFTPAPIPEPGTVLAVAAAGLGLFGFIRRRRR